MAAQVLPPTPSPPPLALRNRSTRPAMIAKFSSRLFIPAENEIVVLPLFLSATSLGGLWSHQPLPPFEVIVAEVGAKLIFLLHGSSGRDVGKVFMGKLTPSGGAVKSGSLGPPLALIYILGAFRQRRASFSVSFLPKPTVHFLVFSFF